MWKHRNLKSDKPSTDFEFKNCSHGTLALVCKKCSEVVFVNFKNS